MLPGSPGTRIDSNGYAILPYLRPYRINSVEIDPKGSNDDVAFALKTLFQPHIAQLIVRRSNRVDLAGIVTFFIHRACFKRRC